MSKKAKKAARELQRLQNLYQKTAESRPIGVSQAAMPTAQVQSSGSAAVVHHSHAYVRRDLITLSILIVVMVAALIGLNLLAEKTAFGALMDSLVGRIF